MLQKKNSFGFNHSDQQDDLYTSMTTSEIKEAFDSRGEELKQHTNNMIDALKATTEGDSGADNIGALDESGNPSTVQAELKKNNLKGHREASELDHADGSVTTRKIAPGSVTREKLANGAVGINEIDPFILGQPKTDFEIQAKFQQHDEQLADTAYHYSLYGIKGDGVTDDTNAMKNAVLNIPKGSTLLLPDKKIKITSNIEINRPIKIHGKKRPVYNFTTNQLESGTIIEGGMITISTGGDGTEIKDVGVINKNGDSFNVCFPVRDIVLDGVMCDANLHGVLIQSNRGLCADVHVKNSQAFNAVHGFVSKATRVTFENCTTFDCSLDGFVWVADNIPAANLIANLQDNMAINCRAINSQLGFNAYARDMFSTNNANGIFFNGLKLIGCTAIGSTVAGFQIGEYNMSNASITYVKPTNVIIDNCSEKGSAAGTKSFRIKNSQAVIVSDTSIEKDYNVDYSDSVYIKLDNLNSLLSNYGNGDDIETFAVNSTAPSVKSGRTIFKTANTAITNIFNITEGKEDTPITILIDDDFTTIQNTQYMVLKNTSGYTNKGSFVILKRDNGVWVELYGKQVPRGMVAKTITTSGAIDLNQSNLFAFTGGTDATTTNKISVTGQLQPGELLTIIVRSSGGTLTFGGFDTMFSVPAGMPTSVTWNNALVTQWAYFPTTSKWVLVSKVENVPYT